MGSLGVCHKPGAVVVSSLYGTVGNSRSTPSPWRIERRNSAAFPESAAAANSATVDKSATVGWYLVF